MLPSSIRLTVTCGKCGTNNIYHHAIPSIEEGRPAILTMRMTCHACMAEWYMTQSSVEMEKPVAYRPVNRKR